MRSNALRSLAFGHHAAARPVCPVPGGAAQGGAVFLISTCFDLLPAGAGSGHLREGATGRRRGCHKAVDGVFVSEVIGCFLIDNSIFLVDYNGINLSFNANLIDASNSNVLAYP